MNKPEFNIGDIVHFRAWKYHPKEGIKAEIKAIRHGSGGDGKSFITGDPDDRYFYRLKLFLDAKGNRVGGVGFFGDLPDLPLVNGISIIESKYFKEPTE
jgi:hypothetical protein